MSYYGSKTHLELFTVKKELLSPVRRRDDGWHTQLLYKESDLSPISVGFDFTVGYGSANVIDCSENAVLVTLAAKQPATFLNAQLVDVSGLLTLDGDTHGVLLEGSVVVGDTTLNAADDIHILLPGSVINGTGKVATFVFTQPLTNVSKYGPKPLAATLTLQKRRISPNKTITLGPIRNVGFAAAYNCMDLTPIAVTQNSGTTVIESGAVGCVMLAVVGTVNPANISVVDATEDFVLDANKHCVVLEGSVTIDGQVYNAADDIHHIAGQSSNVNVTVAGACKLLTFTLD